MSSLVRRQPCPERLVARLRARADSLTSTRRLEVQKRVENGGEVKTSDLAALLELFQSALLSYWAFEPMSAAQRKLKEQAEKEHGSEGSSSIKDDKKERPSSLSGRTPASSSSSATRSKGDGTKFRSSLGAVPEPVPEKSTGPDLIDSRSLGEVQEPAADVKAGEQGEQGEQEDEPQPPPKRIPVFFLDEAHKVRPSSPSSRCTPPRVGFAEMTSPARTRCVDALSLSRAAAGTHPVARGHEDAARRLPRSQQAGPTLPCVHLLLPHLSLSLLSPQPLLLEVSVP